jgi:glyoxylase-like metal-dependent hydrolase (beta-lactamase superfamily II)/ferredoxin
MQSCESWLGLGKVHRTDLIARRHPSARRLDIMANLNKRVAENVPGPFFVDETCINCDTCRQIAPCVFGEGHEYAFVHSQPQTPDDQRQALRALVSCPTGSIGADDHLHAKSVMQDFPLLIESPVYYCGFNSRKSYGGNSYLIRHPNGNWLVDSPKYLPQFVRQLESLGGIANIFLTHRDDVADADKYARYFSSRRIIDRRELASQPDAELVLDGDQAVEIAPGFLAIPTPGHTRGHQVLLFDQRFLFTGDHLDWDRQTEALSASRDYCWYSWPQQIESMARLLDYTFEWVLPGHGQRVKLPPEEMKRELSELVERMRAA